MKNIFRHIELIFWVSALFWLSLVEIKTAHFTFCPLNNAGLDFCPGCGLGQSISLIFSCNVLQSFEAHPLGLFALIIILHRIFVLISNYIKFKELHNESTFNPNVPGR
ncbi:MAG: DUF2752 domain-containing protein [Desulfobulbaceae bacterium]|nr:DUF2752 domain-containing protein [Candidatus Kapabacteria bacterium]MBS3999846.1 DUF2752 domain-containing protein [Desulfobulbaceae bacterium]